MELLTKVAASESKNLHTDLTWDGNENESSRS